MTAILGGSEMKIGIDEALEAVAENCRKGCSECPYLDVPTSECMVLNHIINKERLFDLDEIGYGRWEEEEE